MPPTFEPDDPNHMRDMRVENFLQNWRNGRLWDRARLIRDVPVAEVDSISWSTSADNPARFYHRGLSEERVEDLTTEWNNGTIFPPVVLFALPENNPYFKYSVAGGNHRIASLLRSTRPKVIDAYIVYENDPEVRDILTALLNRLEGFGLTREELLKLGVHKFSHGWQGSIKQLADVLGVSSDPLRKRIKGEEVAKRNFKLGIPEWEDVVVKKSRLSLDAQGRFDKLTHDVPFASLSRGVIQLLQDHRHLTISTEVIEVIDDMSRKPSDQEQVAAAQQFVNGVNESMAREKADLVRSSKRGGKTDFARIWEHGTNLSRIIKSSNDALLEMEHKHVPAFREWSKDILGMIRRFEEQV